MEHCILSPFMDTYISITIVKRHHLGVMSMRSMFIQLGEFNHLLALYLVSTYVCNVHLATAIFFLAFGGYLAGLNHTRHDMVLLGGIYDSKAHDVHHRIPQSNYGQYTMLWDKILDTYRPYNPNDRINPSAQLDLKNGKSLNYEGPQVKDE
jgi:sterol desaturase/sphingolipid hydroxylase (fatty acid hydroxylase superfamily)